MITTRRILTVAFLGGALLLTAPSLSAQREGGRGALPNEVHV